MSWPQIQKKKKSLLWSVVFSYFTQQWITSQSDCGTCDTKRTVYHNHWQTTQLDWEKLQSTSQSQVKAKVAQSCLTLCNAMDYMVHGILKARILEWVAFPFSRGSSQARDLTQVSCIAGRFFTRWATREDKFAPKNVMVIVWWSTACLIHHSLLNRGKTISSEKYAHQISDMNQKLESIDQKKGLNSSYEHPITYHIASALIVEQIGLWSFVSSTIFSWPFPSQLPLHASGLRFAGIMLPQPAGGRKCFPRVHWTPKHGFLCYRNKQTYFSLAKMCWL